MSIFTINMGISTMNNTIIYIKNENIEVQEKRLLFIHAFEVKLRD